MKDHKFLIAGVGGQGNILASDILAEVGIRLGYDAKKSDILGLAVRGGSVVSHIQWAERVHAPVVDEGDADYLIGFEWLEAFRQLPFVRSDGVILVNDHRIDPITVSSGEAEYPSKKEITQLMMNSAKQLLVIEATRIAIEIGDVRTFNIVILGALSKAMDTQAAVWRDVIKEKIPRKLSHINLKAFSKGRALVS